MGSIFLNMLIGLGLGVLILTVYCLWRLFHSIWLKPKRLERLLREQGINGTSYKLIYGDLNQINHSLMEAWSKPMSLNHHIVPRVDPLIHQMVQNHGKISMFWIGTTPRLIIAEAELMREILMDKNGHFQKPPTNPLLELLTLGLSTLEREKWAKRRKLMTPAFHHDKIHGMMPTFMLSCDNLIKRWKEKLEGSPQPGTLEMDIASEFQDFSADVISRAAFGSTLEEGKRIFQLQKEQVVLTMEAARAVYFPGLEFLPTKKNKRRYEIDNEIKKQLRATIQKKELQMRNGESTEKDLLGLLLRCKTETDSHELTIEDLLEECKLFYFAGQETTANLLTWTLIVLSIHPNWQEMAREEVVQKCGKNKPDLDTVNRLKIVSMVLHEVLRLYTPVIGVFRNTYKSTKIGSMTIPPGVDLFLPTLLLHHDPKYWGEDAEEFKPDRFAEGVSKATKDDHIAFYPFGWGPRICIGQNFAMLEAKLALAMVLQNFSFELSPSYTHAPHTIITLQPQHGAPVILHQL